MVCQPVVLNTFGGMGAEARKLVSLMAKDLATDTLMPHVEAHSRVAAAIVTPMMERIADLGLRAVQRVRRAAQEAAARAAVAARIREEQQERELEARMELEVEVLLGELRGRRGDFVQVAAGNGPNFGVADEHEGSRVGTSSVSGCGSHVVSL